MAGSGVPTVTSAGIGGAVVPVTVTSTVTATVCAPKSRWASAGWDRARTWRARAVNPPSPGAAGLLSRTVMVKVSVPPVCAVAAFGM